MTFKSLFILVIFITLTSCSDDAVETTIGEVKHLKDSPNEAPWTPVDYETYRIPVVGGCDCLYQKVYYDKELTQKQIDVLRKRWLYVLNDFGNTNFNWAKVRNSEYTPTQFDEFQEFSELWVKSGGSGPDGLPPVIILGPPNGPDDLPDDYPDDGINDQIPS